MNDLIKRIQAQSSVSTIQSTITASYAISYRVTTVLCARKSSSQTQNSSSELEKLDLEIEEAKISLRRKKREIASVPDEPDILFRSEECDAFDTIEALREILNLVEKGGLDKD
ncbi:hypothetical protein EV182_008416, partial [Spiromyces aspiralis]